MAEIESGARRGSSSRGSVRAALLTAGHQLLAQQSIESLAVDDITQTAGVAKGSFYTHFTDKTSFASTILRDIRGDIEARVELANECVGDPAQRVCRAFAVYVDYMLSTPQRGSVFRRISQGLASAENPLNRGVLGDVAAGLRTGRFVVPSVNAGALFIIGACEVAMQAAVDGTSDAETMVLAQQLAALLLRGLGLEFREAETLSASAVHDIIQLEAGVVAKRAAKR